jgi:hypothetical protein
MKRVDPLETVTVKNESSWWVYEVRHSEVPRLRAEALISETVDSLDLRGRNIRRAMTPKRFEDFREKLIGFTETRMGPLHLWS